MLFNLLHSILLYGRISYQVYTLTKICWLHSTMYKSMYGLAIAYQKSLESECFRFLFFILDIYIYIMRYSGNETQL